MGNTEIDSAMLAHIRRMQPVYREQRRQANIRRIMEFCKRHSALFLWGLIGGLTVGLIVGV